MILQLKKKVSGGLYLSHSEVTGLMRNGVSSMRHYHSKQEKDIASHLTFFTFSNVRPTLNCSQNSKYHNPNIYQQTRLKARPGQCFLKISFCYCNSTLRILVRVICGHNMSLQKPFCTTASQRMWQMHSSGDLQKGY